MMSEKEGPAVTKPEGPGRIRALKEQIADLKKRLPAHSTPPAMLQRLEDLEEELEHALAQDKAEKL